MGPFYLLALLVHLPGCEATAWERVAVCGHEGQKYSLVLPAGYEATKRYPAIVILHGAGRNYHTLVDDFATRGALLQAKEIIVLPDGGLSWWQDDARLVRLLDWLETRLSIDSRRVVCGGWSMGGYGSLRLVTRHAERFAGWGGMIGLVDYPNASYPAASNYPVAALFGDPAAWASANPMKDVEGLRGKQVWFATADQAFDAAMNRELDRVLTEKQIVHRFEVVEGKHDFEAVTTLLPKMLSFFEQTVQ
ncbi:MAG TPA: alpha/beta hydrolase-fold protein [Bryobacteraceae bacterium]|jgi:poly(3-hydroxybutyrate) depolymerase